MKLYYNSGADVKSIYTKKGFFMNTKRIVVSDYQSNCYIIWDKNNKCGIIDPGSDSQKITAFINDRELKPEKILLTHGHFDHIGAAKTISEKYDIPVYVNEKEMVVVKEGGVMFGMEFDIPKNIVFFNDGDEISIGNEKIKVIETPGHTAGSSCFLVDNLLYSGDTLFLGTIGRWDFPTGSLDELKNSVLKTLFSLPEDITVYPGHGFSTTIKKEKISNMIIGY